MDFRGCEMVRHQLVLLVFLALFFSGCLATKTEAECDALVVESVTETWKAGQAPMCYHELAVQYAIMKDSANAIDACENSATAAPLASPFAHSERNNCLAEVAEILQDEDVCDFIDTSFADEPLNPIGGLWNSYVDECKKKANATQEVTVCGTTYALLALPLLLLVARYKQG